MARDTGLTSPRFNKNRTTLDKYYCSYFSSPIEFFLEVKKPSINSPNDDLEILFVAHEPRNTILIGYVLNCYRVKQRFRSVLPGLSVFTQRNYYE